MCHKCVPSDSFLRISLQEKHYWNRNYLPFRSTWVHPCFLCVSCCSLFLCNVLWIIVCCPFSLDHCIICHSKTGVNSVTCFRPDIAEKIAHLPLNNNHSLGHYDVTYTRYRIVAKYIVCDMHIKKVVHVFKL